VIQVRNRLGRAPHPYGVHGSAAHLMQARVYPFLKLSSYSWLLAPIQFA
jgi:hypothetical protein